MSERSAEADAAWKAFCRKMVCHKARGPRKRGMTMLESNLWHGLSVLSHLERVGYLQAVADVVADYERLEKERGL